MSLPCSVLRLYPSLCPLGTYTLLFRPLLIYFLTLFPHPFPPGEPLPFHAYPLLCFQVVLPSSSWGPLPTSSFPFPLLNSQIVSLPLPLGNLYPPPRASPPARSSAGPLFPGVSSPGRPWGSPAHTSVWTACFRWLLLSGFLSVSVHWL